MRLKSKLQCFILLALVLTSTTNAIEYLRGTTTWDVAEIKGISVGEFHPYPWVFISTDPNANSGSVSVQDKWSGTWREVGCNTIYCEMTQGGRDSWYLSFVNSKYFVAYREERGHYYLYRLGKMHGEPYGGTIQGDYPW
jgi:hypothetical protein